MADSWKKRRRRRRINKTRGRERERGLSGGSCEVKKATLGTLYPVSRPVDTVRATPRSPDAAAPLLIYKYPDLFFSFYPQIKFCFSKSNQLMSPVQKKCKWNFLDGRFFNFSKCRNQFETKSALMEVWVRRLIYLSSDFQSDGRHCPFSAPVPADQVYIAQHSIKKWNVSSLLSLISILLQKKKKKMKM